MWADNQKRLSSRLQSMRSPDYYIWIKEPVMIVFPPFLSFFSFLCPDHCRGRRLVPRVARQGPDVERHGGRRRGCPELPTGLVCRVGAVDMRRARVGNAVPRPVRLSFALVQHRAVEGEWSRRRTTFFFLLCCSPVEP